MCMSQETKVNNSYILDVKAERKLNTLNESLSTQSQIPIPKNDSIESRQLQADIVKNEKVPWRILIGMIIVLVGFLIVFISSGDKGSNKDKIIGNEGNLISVAEPMSGDVLMGVGGVQDMSQLTVEASGGASCMVKIKTTSGITKLAFYVRAGETATIGVPKGNYYVYFATGSTWYGLKDLFGEDTVYFKDAEIRDFIKYTWEYELTQTSSGNFSETPIDASEF